MNKLLSLVAAIILVSGCSAPPRAPDGPLPDINLGAIAPSSDGIRYSAYPNGDKPVAGCTSITTDSFTEGAVGDGDGQGCKAGSGDYDLVVSGSAQPANGYLASKDAGAADVQIEGRITDSYTGTSQTFSNVGIELRESTASTSWLIRCHSLNAGATALQVQYGANGSYTTVNGAAGQSRPRYCAITYDVSTGDLKAFGSSDGTTWDEIASTNRAMSDVLCAIVGTSRSTGENLSATIDNFACGSTIDAYTPASGSAPSLVSSIGAQSATQNSAFSLDCNANWSGATSYSFSGLPTGVTQGSSASCAISGTPTGTGTSNVTVTATNASGSTDSTFSIVVAPEVETGSVFTIAASASSRTYTGSSTSGANGANWSTIRTSGSNSRPLAGDTIVLAGGSHGKLTFSNMVGAPGSPITLRNDTASGSAAAISGSGGRLITINGSTNYFVVDGTGGIGGSSAAQLGINESTFAEKRTGAGITVTATAAVTSGIQIMGRAQGVTVKGVTVTAPFGNSICIQVNDHTIADDGTFRDGLTFYHNYLHDCGSTSGGVGLYICWPDGDIHCKNVEVAYNLIEDTGFDSMNIKGAWTGTNSIHHNHFYRANMYNGVDATGTNGISIGTAGNLSIYSNYMEDMDDQCVRYAQNPSPPSGFSVYLYIYNNILVRCAAETLNEAVKASASGFDIDPLRVYNNTIIDPGGKCMTFTGNVVAAVNNNICAGSTSAKRSISGGTQNSNLTSLTTSGNNFANAGSDNYELTSTSQACNSASNPYGLTQDYEDETRPQDSANDQGADEAASCP